MAAVRTSFAVLLTVLAAWPLALWTSYTFSPELAATVARSSWRVGNWLLISIPILGLVVAMVWPPTLPLLGLWWKKTSARLGTDLRPLREAQMRLAHGETPADHTTAGRVLRGLGEPQQAIPHLLRAVQLDPQHLASRFELSLALAAASQHADAAKMLATVVAGDRGHAFGGALLELGLAQHAAGDHERAIETLLAHAAEDGDSRRGALALAQSLRAAGRGDEAKAALAEAANAPLAGSAQLAEERVAAARARWLLRRLSK